MKSERIKAAVFDYLILIVLAVSISVFMPSYRVSFLGFGFELYKFFANFVFLLSYCLFKDLIFGNASLGKHIFGLQIVDNVSGQKATKVSIFLRSILTIVLFYIDFVRLTNDKDRLCDIWCKTRVAKK